MTKLIISDEAAKAVVKAGTTLKTKSVQRVPRIQDSPSQGESQIFDFLGVNTSNSDIVAGDLLSITGFYPSTVSYDVAKGLLLGNKLKVAVRKATASYSGKAVAITGARGGVEGSLLLKSANGSLFFTDLQIESSATNYQWVTENGVVTTQRAGAYAKILFRTAIENGRCVAMCLELVTRTVTYSADQYVYQVTSSSETVDIPTGVVVSGYTPAGSIVISPSSVVTDIIAENGVLGVQTEPLTATFSGTEGSISAHLNTQQRTFVKLVGANTKGAVSSVSVFEN